MSREQQEEETDDVSEAVVYFFLPHLPLAFACIALASLVHFFGPAGDAGTAWSAPAWIAASAVFLIHFAAAWKFVGCMLVRSGVSRLDYCMRFATLWSMSWNEAFLSDWMSVVAYLAYFSLSCGGNPSAAPLCAWSLGGSSSYCYPCARIGVGEAKTIAGKPARVIVAEPLNGGPLETVVNIANGGFALLMGGSRRKISIPSSTAPTRRASIGRSKA